MNENAASRIKERREALGMTQEQLAEKMGFKGKSSISKIEGAGGKVTLKTIEKAARALGCSTSYLMGWTDSPIPVLNAPEQKLIPTLEKAYSNADIEKAMMLYEKYKDSPRQIQEAVEVLLKPDQSDA